MTSVSRGGIYAGCPWPFEKTTQAITFTGLPDINPTPNLSIDECLNALNKTSTDNLEFKCESGSCFI